MKQRILKFNQRSSKALAGCFLILGIISLSLYAPGVHAAPTDVPAFHSMINRFDPASANGKFSDAYGVAIDSSGNIFVLDRDNSRVQKFNSSSTYISQWGTSGSGDGQFDYARDIAIDPVGNVFVVDTGNNRVQKFDNSGNYISQFGSQGSADGQFDTPNGIAIDSTGNLFVTDDDNYRVQKFDNSGNYISQFGSQGNDDGDFDGLTRLAVDSTDNVYVVDANNYRIQKFDNSGNYISQFGSQGSADGEFNNVYSVTVDGNGNIYVVDRGQDRVQKFNSSYDFQSSFGVYGEDSEDGAFDNPRGIAHDASNNIYVTDSSNENVQKFTSNGTFVSQFGEYGELGISPSSDNGKFNAPRDMAQDSHGNIYVADGANNRIQKFTSGGVFIEAWGANSGDGTNGTGNGEFDFPESIIIDSSDNVYVGDANNYRVQKLDSDGNFIAKWGANGGDGSSGSGDGEFNGIRGIAIAPDGNLLVVDEGNYRIQKLNSTTGAFISKFGTSGNADGEFSAPAGVATDFSGNIYVADMYNNRIQKFSSNGTFVSKWGANGGDSSSGSGDGEFSAVSAVDVDSQGNVYALDYDNARVQKFDANGNFLAKWGSPGTGDGQFNHPEGLQVSANGNTVMVADSDNERIQIFKYGSDEVSSDLNGDSIDDSTQSNVGGYTNPVTGKITAIDVGSACELTTDDYVLENQLAVQDAAYNYESGLWDFEADCGTPGYTTTIKLYYYDISPDGKVLRKHNPNTNAYFTIDDANISTQNINGHTVTVVTYQITDGGERDIDGLINGLIKDPAGLAQSVVGAPNTGL